MDTVTQRPLARETNRVRSPTASPLSRLRDGLRLYASRFPALVFELRNSLNLLLTFLFVVISAFIVADIVNTIVKASLQTTPSFTMPKAAKRQPGPLPASVADGQAASSSSALQPLQLIGTITGAYPYAVILPLTGKEPQIYRLRDDVDGGWRIQKIERNRIVLKKGEKEEVVEVKFAEAGPLKPAVAGAAPRGRIRLDPREVEGALADLNKIITQARVVPYMVGGKISGYRIFEIVPGSIYNKLGLQDNDVVERVNGVEIKSPDSLYQLFQQIRNQRQIALDFSRSGKRESVNIEIR